MNSGMTSPAQGINSLLWAKAKLLDSGQPLSPELKEVVAALRPRINSQDQLSAQAIANLFWAMGKLLYNGQPLSPELKKDHNCTSALCERTASQFQTSGTDQPDLGHGFPW